MRAMDDDRPIAPKPSPVLAPADLDRLSVDEIETRIGLLQEEIARLERAKAAKIASRDAAHSVFKF
ncbi:MAG: hypothetical protein B7Y12_20540 [Rhizobiales bacterium 24-66-13]|nr:MAG: hypothetical protein B7Y61_20270 [Rhizobiales bacterium 35-66-30]OYZ68401.1 MAG: hypothetical protein B7Y12_20540 [Rhizobiales bacterium 24-66-13]OZB08612.1 MAG: hypothetical protein B7X67_07700 [Rhizobiales bacterium 39-66-18]HQS09441.1 DUF1192 domain-containing protein [Xanthobacteraceae bacterium]